jgi:hypothetical protein
MVSTESDIKLLLIKNKIINVIKNVIKKRTLFIIQINFQYYLSIKISN